ncbi:MAG: 4-(cytidine 5'-diphospho)-2-C-methyl-D-erythritol kinase [Pirellulales bacterium]|nr:4-(cytidine 5'-diphospho)-2-C-methyl-D-erythritol kinase [Pirellulales bacterium]
MILSRQESTWEVRAPAKLNLCLDVLRRREDGYHEVETLMVPLKLHDTITVISEPPADGGLGPIQLRVISPQTGSVCWSSVPLGHKNLVYRAVDALRQAAGIGHGARIQLIKRIPAESGLGGGSSDAAAALVAANAAWNLHWNRTRLEPIALSIGSDVPFFLDGGAAVCRGRGERVARVHHATPLHVVVVRPPAGLSTLDVFQSFDSKADHFRDPSTISSDPATRSRRITDAVSALIAGKLSDLGQLLFNRLEYPARNLTDWIDRLAYAFGKYVDVAGHAMTGSGTAYFGICRNARHAHRTAAILQGHRMGWICTSQAVSWIT